MEAPHALRERMRRRNGVRMECDNVSGKYSCGQPEISKTLHEVNGCDQLTWGIPILKPVRSLDGDAQDDICSAQFC